MYDFSFQFQQRHFSCSFRVLYFGQISWVSDMSETLQTEVNTHLCLCLQVLRPDVNYDLSALVYNKRTKY